MIRPTKQAKECIDAGRMAIKIPLTTVSLANSREHWAVRARRAREHRREAFSWTPLLAYFPLPLTVTLTRISPRQLDDDNLRSALKSVRDGVADRLVIDDRDPRVKWEYGQRKGGTGERAVEILVERK